MRLLFVVVCATVVAGCSGGGGAKIDRSELPDIVLQRADLGAGFTRFDEGRQVSADAHAGSREDPTRFRREEGWKSRFRNDRFRGRGITVVESRADLFDKPGGAEKDLDAYREELESTAKLIDLPKLGDGAVAAEWEQGLFLFITVAWRRSNATASVLVQGQARTTSLADVTALARRQDRRLAAAAAD